MSDTYQHERRRRDRRNDDREMPERMAVVETILERHVEDCVKRGARLERVAWAGIAMLTALIAAFAKVHLLGIGP